MKPQYIYISLAGLIVVILSGVWFGTRNVEVTPPSQEIIVQEQEQQGALLGLSQQFASAPLKKKPAITIIKRPSIEKKTIPAIDEVDESLIRKKVKPSTSPEEAPPELGGGGGGGGSSGPGSGSSGPDDKRRSKRPTEAESNEMNAQGIILY
jgi:hypothetical protein